MAAARVAGNGNVAMLQALGAWPLFGLSRRAAGWSWLQAAPIRMRLLLQLRVWELRGSAR